MNIAIIPARGGSRRIPRKNIKNFCGKPMIAWSIEAAHASQLFTHVIVSTDDGEISGVASDWGAEVPFVRPPELSDDHTGTTAVVAHATRWALSRGWKLSAVCCLYATAPFVAAEDLVCGAAALASGDWQYAFSATEFSAPIFRAFQRLPSGGVGMFFPEHAMTRSQDLPVAFHDAGQFYWGRTEAWLASAPIFTQSSIPVMIPRARSQDIDTPEDWAFAESLFNLSRHQSGERPC